MPHTFIRKYSNQFVSRWLILCVDITITIFAFYLACLLRYNFNIVTINWSFLKYHVLFLLYVRAGCFFYFRSYTGIIRHTSIEDAILLFKVTTLSTLVASCISLFIRYIGAANSIFYIPISILCIDYFICLFLLIASRFLVKSLYEFITSGFQAPTPVLIYGAGHSGLITKNVLLRDRIKEYEIVGFIDDNEKKINKTIEGVRVYSLETALTKLLPISPDIEVIVAIQSISKTGKRRISDRFLEEGIVVKTVPPVEKWVAGEFAVNQIHNIKIEDLLSRDPIQIDTKQINEELSGKTILVTGAAGSIGSEIVRQLLLFFPSKIILVDQAESALYDLEFEIKKKIPENTQVQVVIGDVTDRNRMWQIFKKNKPQFVFHAAAYKHVPLMENNPYEAVKVNVLGTKNIADLSAEMGVNKFIMVSTDKAVNPTNVMGATKRLAEMYTQSMNHIEGIRTKYIATRFGNVLGSNGSVIPLFKKQIENGGPVTVTHPEITRYFMTIPEACQLVLEAASMGKGGEVFVFDMGESVKIVDLAKKMIVLSGLTLNKDITIEFSGLRPGEKLYEELLNTDENTLPTHHPKIMIAQLTQPSFAMLEIALGEVERYLLEGTNKELISLIKELVPEFVSNNSVYEELDKSRSIKVKK
ncbi:MAG: nucleoside-diphosphate sugar epimerase/dehydratase [Flectobacillus sp.]|nr:nucleoside-diphosphate sugar epimerase/dehydratase [Flectobacillus sp.]